MPRDGFALFVGKAKHASGTLCRDMSMNKGVHAHNTLHTGIPVQIAAEQISAPVIAKEVMQQRCTDDRSGFVPGQTHPAGDGVSRLRYGNRMVIDRIFGSVMLKQTQLLKAWMLQNMPHELLELAVQWTHPFRYVLSLLYVAGCTKTMGKMLHYCDILLKRIEQPPGDAPVQHNRSGKANGFSQRKCEPDGSKTDAGKQHRRRQDNDELAQQRNPE